MKPDPSRPPDADAASTDAWLDGLAGRPGQGEAHDEGALWRQALQTPDVATAPGAGPGQWQAVVEAAQHRLAHPPAASASDRSPLAPPSSAPGPWSAGRLPKLGRAWATASAVLLLPLLVGGIWLVLGPADDTVRLRGLAPGGVGLAVDEWRSERPAEAAQALAARLEAAGARVVLVPVPPGMELRVQADGAVSEAVRAELMAIEATLDAEGRATVRVLPLAGEP